jgi:hypothetical protein
VSDVVLIHIGDPLKEGTACGQHVCTGAQDIQWCKFSAALDYTLLWDGQALCLKCAFEVGRAFKFNVTMESRRSRRL